MIEWIIPLSIIGLIILGMQIKNYTYPSQIQKEFTKEFNKQWEQIKMTEKRFKLLYSKLDNGMFIDKEKKFDDIFVDKEFQKIGLIKIVDLLNQLDEDNKQYKILVESLKDENQKLKLKLKDLGVEYY